MKKNLYYRLFFQRQNRFKEMLTDLFFSLASWPRLLLEVFIRKNFGERYFSVSTAIILTVLLAIFPYLIESTLIFGFGRNNVSDVFSENISWYLFLVAFVYSCFLRWQEIRRLPSVFDFGRFSLSTGIVHPRFYAISLGGKPVDIRTIETVLEPGFFFLVGLVLWWMDQSVGMLLLVCSVLYSLSYVAAYKKGDDYIMDIIDKRILNEEMVSTFVDELDPSKTRGVHFYGRRPADPETRRMVADLFTEEDDVVEAR